MNGYLGLGRRRDGGLLLEFSETELSQPTSSTANWIQSPVFSLVGDSIALPPSGEVVVLYPKSVRATLASIVHRHSLPVQKSTYFTFGLGAVVLFKGEGANEHETAIAALAEGLVAIERWEYSDFSFSTRDISVEYLVEEPADPPEITFQRGTLPHSVVRELDDLERNLSALWQIVAVFAPEYEEVIRAARDNTTEVLIDLQADLDRQVAGATRDNYVHACVALLADLNSCTTLAVSQIGACVPPVALSRFAVARHSLFGVGTALRAVWALYLHVARIFTAVDHNGRIKIASAARGFDPHASPDELSSATWSEVRPRVPEGIVLAPDPHPRRHIVFFSSRWGFHENLNSISVAWQCLRASSLPEWTLLTFSHEYIHSLYRELVDSAILGLAEAGELGGIVDAFNNSLSARPGRGDALPNLRDAMRFFLINQMRFADEARAVVEGRSDRASFEVGPITEIQLRHLVDSTLTQVIEEYVVHMLDYAYFYDEKSDKYVHSIWRSWATVPGVRRKLEHYIVRTLLAISVSDASDDVGEAFGAAVADMKTSLAHARVDADTALVDDALAALNDPQALGRILVSFKANRALARFVKVMLIDTKVYSDLMEDLTANDSEDGLPAYPWSPGEFPVAGPESPAGFLLDRQAVACQSEFGIEKEALWQFIMLT